jgi:hypothetical protein
MPDLTRRPRTGGPFAVYAASPRARLRFLWPCVLLLAAALAGCDSQPAADPPVLTGHYVGFGGGYTWDLDLSDSGGALTGTGTVTTDDGSFPLTVGGATTFPVVGLSLDAADLGLFTFDGRVTNEGDVLTGTVAAGDGFSAEMSFQRQ